LKKELATLHESKNVKYQKLGFDERKIIDAYYKLGYEEKLHDFSNCMH